MGRDELIKAAETENVKALASAGWLAVYDALRDWFAGRTLTLPAFATYLQLLGTEPPDLVLKAVQARAGHSKWRPEPADVYRTVMGAAAHQQNQGPEKGLRADQQPATLERVLWLRDIEGARVCDCMPRPIKVRIDSHHVLRCCCCHGLEQGQIYQAEDAS